MDMLRRRVTELEGVTRVQAGQIAQLKRYLEATRSTLSSVQSELRDLKAHPSTPVSRPTGTPVCRSRSPSRSRSKPRSKLTPGPTISRSCPASPSYASVVEKGDKWQTVGAKAASRSKSLLMESRSTGKLTSVASQTVSNTNRFTALDSELDQGQTVDNQTSTDEMPRPSCKPKSVIVLGDSNVRRLEGPIKSRLDSSARSKVKLVSYSGIGIDSLTEKVPTVLNSVKCDTVKVIVHVGTNDIRKAGSQELLTKLRNLIRAAHDARSGVSVEVCSIPSRTDQGGYVFSRSESVNNQLARLCESEGASCIDLGYVKSPLGRDGVHYSPLGAAVVANNLAGKINSFLG